VHGEVVIPKVEMFKYLGSEKGNIDEDVNYRINVDGKNEGMLSEYYITKNPLRIAREGLWYASQTSFAI